MGHLHKVPQPHAGGRSRVSVHKGQRRVLRVAGVVEAPQVAGVSLVTERRIPSVGQ